MGKLYTESKNTVLWPEIGIASLATRIYLFASGQARSHVNEEYLILKGKTRLKGYWALGTFVGDGLILNPKPVSWFTSLTREPKH